MKLAISNIAWQESEELQVAKLLNDLKIEYVEIAPSKKWAEPVDATAKEIDDYFDFWKQNNLEIVAFQSVLYPHPELKIFDDKTKQKTLEYLKKMINLADKMNVRRIVFGSPKNRQKDDLTYDEAFKIATEFFKQIGEYAKQRNVIFCIEPNPEAYSCDFITRASQALELVKAVDSDGFGLHLDTACMFLAGDDLADSIKAAGDHLKHFHISAPQLSEVGSNQIDYKAAADALKQINYDGVVSIEMRSQESGNIDRVKSSIEFVRSIFD